MRYIEKQEQRASHPIYTGSCLQRGELYFSNPSVLWPDRQPTWLSRIRCLTTEKINLGDRNPNLNFLIWRQTEWPGVPQQSIVPFTKKPKHFILCQINFKNWLSLQLRCGTLVLLLPEHSCSVDVKREKKNPLAACWAVRSLRLRTRVLKWFWPVHLNKTTWIILEQQNTSFS